MKIDIKLITDNTLYLDFENLKSLKHYYEDQSIEVDSIYFDVDYISLSRLQMISYLDKIVQFRDANNEIVSLSGSQIKTYIPTIEGKLGERYEKINEFYNTYKVKLSASEIITHYNAASAFFEHINDTSFTEDDYIFYT